jgi:hypothetical protein
VRKWVWTTGGALTVAGGCLVLVGVTVFLILLWLVRLFQMLTVGAVLSLAAQLAAWDALLWATFGPSYWIVLELIRLANSVSN